jgi:hypothetical protein
MLRDRGEDATALLNLQDSAALARLRAAMQEGWRREAAELLAVAEWKLQLVAAAALALGGADEMTRAALWRAIDGTSWVGPQLVAAAFVVDAEFATRAEERLLAGGRRPPKTMGALVRAYHRLPAPRMPVVAQLGRLDRLMATEEARVGVRGVDAWLDRLA